jgi:hypothetical protein
MLLYRFSTDLGLIGNIAGINWGRNYWAARATSGYFVLGWKATVTDVIAGELGLLFPQHHHDCC